MARTTVITPQEAGATSTDIVLAAGASVTVDMFVTSGSVPASASATVWLATPGTDTRQFELSSGSAKVISGPGTYRVVKAPTAGLVGVFTET